MWRVADGDGVVQRHDRYVRINGTDEGASDCAAAGLRTTLRALEL